MITYVLMHFYFLQSSLLFQNLNICFRAHISVAQCDEILETNATQTDAQILQRPERDLNL